MTRNGYIPALRFDWLTRVYDPIVRLTVRERAFKRQLIQQLGVRPGHRVLDLGCGTGTLALAIAEVQPGVFVTGLDGDPKVLEIARHKIARAGMEIALHHADATSLDFAEGTFDRVVSSLVFHHLDRDAKQRALREAFRVLAPGGELHIADWGRPHGPVMRTLFFGVQLLDGFGTTQDSVRGVLPTLMTEAGFADVTETRRMRTPLGTLSLYRGHR